MAPETSATCDPGRSVPHPLDEKFQHLSISYHVTVPFTTVVRLDRPKKRNAINARMWREIGEVFHEVAAIGDGCRCVLLVGSEKGFCGGIDTTDELFFGGMSSDDGVDSARKSLALRYQILQMQAAFTAVEECPVPVVAAIQGACVGAGVDLVCCADVRVCASNSLFGIREVRLGLAADVGTLQRFPKLVGFGSRVRELCLTGENFDAQEAFKIGFVSRISTPENELHDVAAGICRSICRNSPVATTVTKLSLNYSRDHSVADGLQHIALQNSSALMTDDLMLSFLAAASKKDTEFLPLQPHARL